MARDRRIAYLWKGGNNADGQYVYYVSARPPSTNDNTGSRPANLYDSAEAAIAEIERRGMKLEWDHGPE